MPGNPPPQPKPRSGPECPEHRTPKPLSAAHIQKRLADLPGWEVRGGNQELVRRYRAADLVAAAGHVATVAILADLAGGHPRIELAERDLIVKVSTPEAGGVTLSDIRCAAYLSGKVFPVLEHTDRLRRLRETTGMWKDRDDLPDFDALRREWER